MSLLSKGVIHLDNFDDENAASDVEEVLQWDKKLRQTKTFMTAVTTLAGRKFESPNLESQQMILLNFLNQPVCDYFWSRSPQVKAFNEIKGACKLGWKMEGMRKKK